MAGLHAGSLAVVMRAGSVVVREAFGSTVWSKARWLLLHDH